MGLLDKGQVEEIKNAVVEAKADAVKESAAKTKIERMKLFVEIADRKYKSGGFTDEQYNNCLNAIGKINGFDFEKFEG